MAEVDATITTFSAFLKQRYLAFPTVEDLMVRNQIGPLCSMLMDNLDTTFLGLNLPFPVLYGGNSGVSNTFSNALANSGPSQSVSMNLTRVALYNVVNLDQQAMLASADNMGAFFPLRAVEVDDARRMFMLTIAQQLYGNGAGLIGKVSSGSTVASTQITLDDINTVVNFSTGMTIRASPNADGSSPRTGTAPLGAVDYNTGNLTTSDSNNWSTDISGLLAGDYLFADGSIGAGVAIAGLGAWLPTSAPSSATFFGVDRTKNSLLYGTIYDGTALNIRDALTGAITAVRVLGGMPDKIFLHPLRWQQLSLLMQSLVRYDISKPSEGIAGFNSLSIQLGSANVEVFADQWCPYNNAYGINSKEVELLSLGEVPFFTTYAKNEIMIVSPTNDAFQIRLNAYLQLGVHKPGFQFVCKLGAN